MNATADAELKDVSRWVALCKELALKRLPPEAAGRIWPDLWRWACKSDELYVIRKLPTQIWNGIIVPTIAQETHHQGYILTVGLECHAFGFTPEALIGREVYWPQYAGTPISRHSMDRKFDSEVLQIGVNELLGIRIADIPEEELAEMRTKGDS